jgi:hypothetical protein
LQLEARSSAVHRLVAWRTADECPRANKRPCHRWDRGVLEALELRRRIFRYSCVVPRMMFVGLLRCTGERGRRFPARTKTTPANQSSLRTTDPPDFPGRRERDQHGGPPSGPAKEKEQADLKKKCVLRSHRQSNWSAV